MTGIGCCWAWMYIILPAQSVGDCNGKVDATAIERRGSRYPKIAILKIPYAYIASQGGYSMHNGAENQGRKGG